MATLDVISYEKARQALSIGVTDTSRRDLLELAITAVSQQIDRAVGPVVQRTLDEVVDVNGGYTIRTRRWPVASYTSVTEYRSGTGTALTAETLTTAGGYLAEQLRHVDDDEPLFSGVLRRRSGFADAPWVAPGRVRIVYVAGRYASTAAAENSRFEEAALLALVAVWPAYLPRVPDVARDEYATSFPSYPSLGLPRAALDRLAGDRIHMVGSA